MKAEGLRKLFADKYGICISDCKFIPEAYPNGYAEWLEKKIQNADEVSQESNKKTAVDFIWVYSDISLSFTYKEIEELYDNWLKKTGGTAMKAEEIPTHTIDGLLLSKWGRIAVYTAEELRNISRELVFAELDEKELIKRLITIIDNINKLPEDQ